MDNEWLTGLALRMAALSELFLECNAKKASADNLAMAWRDLK